MGNSGHFWQLMKTEIITAGSGRNYVFMSARGPWGKQAEEMSTHREEPECYCNDSSFPCADVFLSPTQSFCKSPQFMVPASLIFYGQYRRVKCCIIKGWILCWDPSQGKKKKTNLSSRFYPKGPLWQLVCVVKNTAGAQAHLKMHLMLNTGLMHKYIYHPPAMKGPIPFGIMALFWILNTSENIYICIYSFSVNDALLHSVCNLHFSSLTSAYCWIWNTIDCRLKMVDGWRQMQITSELNQSHPGIKPPAWLLLSLSIRCDICDTSNTFHPRLPTPLAT